ncbi:MAG: hypothetical protein E7378_00550 [Clostridiales bacterium]|nr:hypothetical protein [Clostridiales bacterium]
MENKQFFATKLGIFLKYLIFFCLFFVLFKAGINYAIFPFAFGVFFALVWCNQNIIVLGSIFLLASFLSNFSLLLLVGNASMVIVSLLFYAIHYKLKKPIKPLHILIYACISNITSLFIKIYYLNFNIYYVFAEFLLGLLYMFMVLKLFEGICVRGLGGKRTSLEHICGFIFVASIFCGMASLSFFNVDLIKFFGALCLLVYAYVSKSTSVIMLASAMGVGSLMFGNNPTYLAVMLIYGLTCCIFKTKNKYISCVALIASEVLSGLYLNFYYSFNILSVLPVLAAVLCFILIPSKILDGYSSKLQESLFGLTQASVINRNRELLYRRLVELSDVFAEMNKVFRSMISGGLVNASAKKMLLNEIKVNSCGQCPHRAKCYKMFESETESQLCQMIDIGFEKGKVTLLDVPTLFAGKCDKLNSLVTSINQLLEQYKSYAGLMNNIDASKVLLAEQLLGVSNIMRSLSLEVNSGVNFEKGKEKKILDELTYNNIICSDALVFEDNNQVLSVTLAVRKEDSLKAGIEKVVSKVCGHKMAVCDEASSARAGWQILTLKSEPKYDCVFGVATKTKTGSVSSGDCYSIIKISDSKYLFALCDGMGSGKKAEEVSSTAIGLIENFYKAGFDKDIILSSVNKLLSLGKDDVFSALDLCVIDTREGVGDFVKMGAPESFVKHKETIDTISLEALPLGIVQNVQTQNKQMYLTSGDRIVLFTDGISDGFKSLDKLRDFVNNLSNSNPQEMAEAIVNKVLTLNGKVAKDDMSVIVAKVFER